jgi:YD repeat-containing protein
MRSRLSGICFMTVKSLSTLAILLLLSPIDGQLNRASAANGSVTYTYDALGRVLSASYDTGVIVIYAYDANGNRTQQTINVNTATLCWNTTTGCSPTSKTAVWDQGLWN